MAESGLFLGVLMLAVFIGFSAFFFVHIWPPIEDIWMVIAADVEWDDSTLQWIWDNLPLLPIGVIGLIILAWYHELMTS